MEALKRKYTSYRISLYAIQRMRELKQRLGFKSYESVIIHLANTAEEKEYPEPSPAMVMGDTVPAILTGKPGSGKTFFARKLVENLDDGPVLVLDVHDEYAGLEKIGFGEFFSLDWAHDRRKLRLVPSPSVDVSKAEADAVFRHLVMFQKELRDWVLIVEEGHRFMESPFLKAFIAEARKHTRKLVVVSVQPGPFEGLGNIFRVTKECWRASAIGAIHVQPQPL